MKHHADAIVELCGETGLSVDRETAEVMLRHLEHVIEANSRVRLTAIDTFEEGFRLHVLDSLLALPEITAAPPGKCADLGTGGGYPGIPLALASGREFCLFDSVRKKIAAVQEFTSAAQVENLVELSVLRAESAGADPLHRGRYAVVMARALSSLPSLVELAAPLLQKDGHFVALKGRLADEELSRGDKVAAWVGMRRVSLRECAVPGGDESRTIVAYQKVGAPSLSLPRRMGLAQRKPLA